ncbi:hypothetical protein [Roseateles amylovorans]|uniref:Uncharacterized protein n=1 Tax=Roseateles amylovorans TaxID=2978473 RepID=A0ABY6B6G5_9BURK|nr:hypothetical protein [Roseateles amylovorans]UXH79536.1 hypothetical protein N4261_06325 [Roseateles amylovorans]
MAGSLTGGHNPFAQQMQEQTNFQSQWDQAVLHKQAAQDQLNAKKNEVAQGVTNSVAKLVGMVQI